MRNEFSTLLMQESFQVETIIKRQQIH